MHFKLRPIFFNYKRMHLFRTIQVAKKEKVNDKSYIMKS